MADEKSRKPEGAAVPLAVDTGTRPIDSRLGSV